jgi:hypothetical protein
MNKAGHSGLSESLLGEIVTVVLGDDQWWSDDQ